MEVFGFDAYTPDQIARRVEEIGVTKARLPLLTLSMLGLLAGAFIALGSLYFTIVASDAGLGFAATRLLGGLVFSLGLVLLMIYRPQGLLGRQELWQRWKKKP